MKYKWTISLNLLFFVSANEESVYIWNQMLLTLTLSTQYIFQYYSIACCLCVPLCLFC
jgi:hypothetical protein